jgi:hypothetical protein
MSSHHGLDADHCSPLPMDSIHSRAPCDQSPSPCPALEVHAFRIKAKCPQNYKNQRPQRLRTSMDATNSRSTQPISWSRVTSWEIDKCASIGGDALSGCKSLSFDSWLPRNIGKEGSSPSVKVRWRTKVTFDSDNNFVSNNPISHII